MDQHTEAHRTLVDAWAFMVARFPEGRIERHEGLTLTFADVPLPFFNIAFLEGEITDAEVLRERLEWAVTEAHRKPNPWLLGLCMACAPDGWEGVCPAAGLHPAVPLTAMATDELTPPRRPPAELSLRRVADEETRRAVGDIHAQAYDLPMGMCRCMAEPGLWQPDVHGWIGELDGQPVSTASVFPVDDILYVAMVATLPTAGGRGYAETVMRHALEQAAQHTGLRRTVLHASDAGRSLYASMGYADTGRFLLLSHEEHA